MQIRLFSALLLVLTLGACTTEENSERYPDTSDIEVDVQIHRFDQALFEIDTNHVVEALSQIETQYADFAPIYFNQVLRSRRPDMTAEQHADWIKGFIQFPAVKKLYDTVQVVYPDMEKLKPQLKEAFQNLKYYFPEDPTPQLTTYISEYSVGAFIFGENDLAVGLDFFLGSDYDYRKIDPSNPVFSDYLTYSFAPEFLVSKAMQTIVNDKCDKYNTGANLLDMMIHNGKKLYLLDHLIPSAPDSVLLEIPHKKVEWLKENEKNMWSFFISEDLIYETDLKKIRKYVDYSPNAPGMPEEAPGRTANWLGWQIVKKYMRLHPETTMEELIENTDFQAILQQSKYKPKR